MPVDPVTDRRILGHPPIGRADVSRLLRVLMRRWAQFAFRWIGPVVFLALVWFTDLSQVGKIWKRGVPWLLVAAALLNIVIILLKTWRWRRLMQLQGISYSYGPAVRYYTIGCAMAAWTPGRLGDFTKAIAVHRERGTGLGRAAASVIADRLLDAVALAAVAAAGAAFLPGPRGIWLAAGGLLISSVGLWIFLRKHRPGELARRGAERIVAAFGGMRTIRKMKSVGRLGGSAGREVGDAIESLASLARPALAASGVATAAATLVTFLQGYLVALSLGLEVGFWTLSVSLAAVSITSLLPVSVAGIGTREATLAIFLRPRGIAMPEILGFSVAYFVIISGSLALIGAAAWVLKAPFRARVTV